MTLNAEKNKGAKKAPLAYITGDSSRYYWRTPPVLMVNVCVPDTFGVTGVAVMVYPPAANAQLYVKPDKTGDPVHGSLFMNGGVAPVRDAILPG